MLGRPRSSQCPDWVSSITLASARCNEKHAVTETMLGSKGNSRTRCHKQGLGHMAPTAKHQIESSEIILVIFHFCESFKTFCSFIAFLLVTCLSGDAILDCFLHNHQAFILPLYPESGTGATVSAEIPRFPLTESLQHVLGLPRGLLPVGHKWIKHLSQKSSCPQR